VGVRGSSPLGSTLLTRPFSVPKSSLRRSWCQRGGHWCTSGANSGELACFRCRCHRHPLTGRLQLVENPRAGTIGLASFTLGGCGCCAPWTVEELGDFVRGLEALAVGAD
jgi:hypothetical protein